MEKFLCNPIFYHDFMVYFKFILPQIHLNFNSASMLRAYTIGMESNVHEQKIEN